MRYLVITDLHANLHALEAVLADAATHGYDQTICLGDLVGYGGDPGEVIDRTLALSPTALIRGNHDKVCAGLEPATLFNDVAKRSVEWTQHILSTEQLQTLAQLPKGPAVVSETLAICHGAPFDEDYYVFDQSDAERAIAASPTRICLFGHTHLPTIFTMADEQADVPDLADGEFALPRTGAMLVNVGSVGQPRDGDPRAAYGLLDLDRQTIRLHRVTYDIAGAQQRIRDAGLPQWLALRLAKGQ